MLRAIHIFPGFDNIHILDRLRAKYDPLFGRIHPHITLVFPFESELTDDDLAAHLQCCAHRLSPFELRMQGITKEDEGYLFLNVVSGRNELIRLHDELYGGHLQMHLRRDIPYRPHLTVGRLEDERNLATAFAEASSCQETFQTTVCEIVMEQIDDQGNSHVTSTVPLGDA